MSKKIQVHNVGGGNHPLIVRVYDQLENGVRNPEKDRLVAVYDVSKFGQVHEEYVSPGRYAVVSEG